MTAESGADSLFGYLAGVRKFLADKRTPPAHDQGVSIYMTRHMLERKFGLAFVLALTMIAALLPAKEALREDELS